MNARALVLIASLMAMNLTLGKIAATLILPVYLDTIGTIIAAVMLPWRYSVGVGVGTSVLAGLVINPIYPFYFGNQLAIASVVSIGAKFGMFSTWWKAASGGMLIACAASIVAAPVTVLLFGGVTLSGTTAINAVLIAAGVNIWQSVLTGSLVIESVDKIAACVICWYVLQRLPPEMLNHPLTNSTEKRSGP